MEIWKDIPGYEGIYQVSDRGRVRNRKGLLLALQPHQAGYRVAHLCRGGVRRIYTVHRLVARVFLGEPSGRLEVCHKNHDKSDNVVTNLVWGTHAENVGQTISAGRNYIPRKKVIGTAISDGKQVFFDSQSAAERFFTGRNTSAIHNVLVGKAQSAFGYTWERA